MSIRSIGLTAPSLIVSRVPLAASEIENRRQHHDEEPELRLLASIYAARLVVVTEFPVISSSSARHLTLEGTWKTRSGLPKKYGPVIRALAPASSSRSPTQHHNGSQGLLRSSDESKTLAKRNSSFIGENLESFWHHRANLRYHANSKLNRLIVEIRK